MKREIVVAVAGNPNVGKSTLFTILTGEIAHVANWPGTTVERKEGIRRHRGRVIRFVDLPGTYSISATSPEEIVAREYIVSGEPDLVLVLVDSTAPERTLNLAVQVLELTSRVVIALTKADAAHSQGIHIHVDKLEEKLRAPVVLVSALKGTGIRELLDTILDVAEGKRSGKSTLRINYSWLEPYISEVESLLRKQNVLPEYDRRWLAIKLLEGDRRLEDLLIQKGLKTVVEKTRSLRQAIERSTGRSISEHIITSRFNYVDSIARETVVRVPAPSAPMFSRIENLLIHPLYGPPLGLLILLAAFTAAFALNTGFPLNIVFSSIGLSEVAELVEEYSLSGLVEKGFSILGAKTAEILYAAGAPSWVVALIAEGVIPGVGSVLSFFPLIVIIYAALSVIEDSGIGPRIAVSMNRFFNYFGLSGKAIYPFMIGLGCNVPAVLASRASIEEEERKQIIVSVPFVPCQARLIVILAFVTAYFRKPVFQALSIISIYAVALLLALATSLATRRVYFRKKTPPELILEIPPIHRPSFKVVWWLTWDYSKHFLRKAGTLIVLLSIATWWLLSYGPGGIVEDVRASYGAILGKAISPLLLLYGVGGENAWKTAFALIQGLAAKEALIETIAVMQGGEVSTKEALLALGLTPLQAYSLLVFMVLYVPCFATIAAIYLETKSLKTTLVSMLYMIASAMIISLTIYYLGQLILLVAT
ncbi:MAG: ferrous iron transport protein B [Thermoprotei archaeon]|nr:MAG: ferrous iron transport protein B [Thermoprotei archaeon]